MTNATPSGFKTDADTMPSITANKMFQTLLDYLKSIDVIAVIDNNAITNNNTITIRAGKLNVSVYIYNAMLVFHGSMSELTSMNSDMYVKQIKDMCGEYTLIYEPEKIKFHLRFKISGNKIYDLTLPITAVIKMSELLNDPTLLPKSLY
jgi:hypothetical protein